jgi:hypothetical protein
MYGRSGPFDPQVDQKGQGGRLEVTEKSRPVSRVLSRTIIPLDSPSPATSSGLPESTRGHALPLARRLSYLALLQVGFAVPSVLPRPRCALTAPFHPCRRHCWRLGGLLSVALSVGSRRPGVTWHLVLRSPDFPPRFARNAATVRPTPRAPYPHAPPTSSAPIRPRSRASRCPWTTPPHGHTRRCAAHR